ncbi:MAG TPA: serine hydrolase domain-containing protein [Candidatus Limiplasma sp.]|nr:serine hydrolase domain-containing protein [Candidatus Limiplasma sp.]
MKIEEIWSQWSDADGFTGVFSAADETGVVFQKCAGFRNRSEQLPNNADTAFGIASGTKLFTGLSVCKLIDAGKLSLEDKLWDILSCDLGQIDKRVTIRHLLTHTSGIGDYLDEEADDYEEKSEALSRTYPLYLWETLAYYLPMITPLPPKFAPGERFGYSNAGFIMLGLAVEAAAGKPYQQFVTDEIITPLQLRRTGFYRMDSLPANTACGYMEDADGNWKTNLFTLPIIGGSDGGLFTCAQDMATLWRALFDGRVLSEAMQNAFLSPQVKRDADRSYGFGVYRMDRSQKTAHYAIGCDAGVHFFSIYFPEFKLTATALNNTEYDIFSLMDALFAAALP